MFTFEHGFRFSFFLVPFRFTEISYLPLFFVQRFHIIFGASIILVYYYFQFSLNFSFFGSQLFKVHRYFLFTIIFGSLLVSVHPNFWFIIIFDLPVFLVHYYFCLTIIFGSPEFSVHY